MRRPVRGDLAARLRPRGRLDRMRVHGTLHAREVPVEFDVRRRIARRSELPFDDLAVEVDDNHVIRRHSVVVDAARLDHHELRLGIEP